MKKLERYEYNCMFDVTQCKLDGYFCTDEDVARLEASHAELLEAAKDMLDWWDHKRPNESAQDYINSLRAAIAKAEEQQP